MSLSDPKKPSSTPDHFRVINGYLWDTLKKIDPELSTYYPNGIVPIFPLTDVHAGNAVWDDKPYIIYNSMIQKPLTPFWPVRREHILYAVRGNAAQTIEWSNALRMILDRQDDSAQDINAWNRRMEATGDPRYQPVYFHWTRLFQSEKTKDRDYTNKPYQITDFVLRTEYHVYENLESLINSDKQW